MPGDPVKSGFADVQMMMNRKGTTNSNYFCRLMALILMLFIGLSLSVCKNTSVAEAQNIDDIIEEIAVDIGQDYKYTCTLHGYALNEFDKVCKKIC